MSNEWDISIIRKIAGLNPITESVDDDDDEDPDVKVAMKDKRQAQFEKKNKNELTRAEKEAANKEKVDAKSKEEEKAKLKSEKKAAPKKAEPKAEEKAEEKAEPKDEEKAEPKAEETSEEKAEEKKQRGAKQDPSKKAGQARAWMDAHPGHKRSEFIKHAGEAFGMGAFYASAFRARYLKKSNVAECYMLSHPALPSFLLAENRELNQLQWIDRNSPLDPMVFESLAEAEKVAKYMSEWKSQYANIEMINLVD